MGFTLARSVRTRLGRGPSTTCGRTNNIASSRNRPPTLARRRLLALAGRRLLLALARRRLLLALETRRLLALATRRLPKHSHASAPHSTASSRISRMETEHLAADAPKRTEPRSRRNVDATTRNEHCVAATRRNALL